MSEALDLGSPARVCARLLAALGASEGRRQRRKRNTTADTIGLEMKRSLLERAVEEAPAAEAFEAWLLEKCEEDGGGGGVRAMALEILEEWRLALISPEFAAWLERGAPSDDAGGRGPTPGGGPRG